MNSTIEHGLKRGADDMFCHGAKRMRLINHAYDHVQSSRGTKRRNEEELEEPVKRNKVTPSVKAVKRKGDTLIMNPTKRVKAAHRTWRRSIQGCRSIHDTGYDHDKDGDNHMASIAIIA